MATKRVQDGEARGRAPQPKTQEICQGLPFHNMGKVEDREHSQKRKIGVAQLNRPGKTLEGADKGKAEKKATAKQYGIP